MRTLSDGERWGLFGSILINIEAHRQAPRMLEVFGAEFTRRSKDFVYSNGQLDFRIRVKRAGTGNLRVAIDVGDSVKSAKAIKVFLYVHRTANF